MSLTRLKLRVIRGLRPLVWLGAGTLLSACGGEQVIPDPILPPVGGEPDLCAAPSGIPLVDIASTVDWINAMPKPLALSCFLSSLPRPLHLNATQSLFSAQPSDGAANPRVFIFFDRLILSIVTKSAPFADRFLEPGVKELLELSFITEGVESIKAEIKFPVTEQISASVPYQGLEDLRAGGSICRVCHANEVQVDTIEGVPVFQSTILKPSNVRSIGFIQNERMFCNESLEADRCAMLASLTDHGELIWQEFPPEAPEL